MKRQIKSGSFRDVSWNANPSDSNCIELFPEDNKSKGLLVSYVFSLATAKAEGNLSSLPCLFLGGFSLHLNHLIAYRLAIYDWPFGTLSFGLFGSNLDTRDLETYPRTYSGHFWNMSIFDDSRAVWVLFRKWVVSENQSFLDEGAIVTPLSV